LGICEETNPSPDLVTIEILDKAENDLVNGFNFYEEQRPGLSALAKWWLLATSY